MKLNGMIFVAALSAATSAWSDPPKNVLEMPAPDFKALDITPDRNASIALIEAAVRVSLKDPDSAKFEWPNGFTNGWYRIPFGKKVTGWITCGYVNAKNSYGGYVGRSPVIAAVDNGQVAGLTIGEPDGSLVTPICAKVGVPLG